MATTKSTLQRIEKALEKVCGRSSLFEAESILQDVLRCSRTELYTTFFPLQISADKTERINSIIRRRLEDEPLAYILGSVYFYSKEIVLTRDVLIPRPETEVLVETVLNQEHNETLFFADIGTGSGAIAAILLAQRPSWTAVATDISCAALGIARRNTAERTRFVCSDMLASFKPDARIFDFVVCNPPYISRKEMAELDKSVISFEPRTALFGGDDGMDFYRILAGGARNILKPGGRIFCEIGSDQAAPVCNMFLFENWHVVKVHNDLAGRTRVFTAHS
jgi:release factor glutamine methyltransferase